jgi:RES domain-containing protein
MPWRGEPIPHAHVIWEPGYRIVSTRQTPEAAFEQIASPAEAVAILRVIAAGRPPRTDPADVATGPGSGWVMAAFLHGTSARFNDDTFGAFYAAESRSTAIAETQFHYARFLHDAGEGHTLLGLRLLLASLTADPLDIRGRGAANPELYDPDPSRYAVAQAWGAHHRASGADGVVYDSVRRAGGACVALFRPRCITECTQGEQLAYEWDGARFTRTIVMRTAT